ncbi:ibr finger domain containing protein [Apiospora saccharicola]|uniref:Ibr finger domain containing protein n=1 Tax=Apiospora saccharicola TaxID=335842 RepID=A0ABR1UQ81_9PEZI
MEVIEQPNTPLVGIDDESLALILDLQRQDETALKLYLEEVAQATVFAFDRRLARSIQTAVQEDANTLHHLLAEEKTATQDHQLSLELSRPGSAQSTRRPPATDTIKSAEDEDMELIEKMEYLYVTGEHDDTEDIYGVSDDETSVVGEGAESSKWAASRPHRTRECVCCGDTRHFTDVSRAPCQHEYCRDCLRRLFEDAMRDESLFPPRCCKKPLPLDKNLLFLPQTVVATFREKTAELSTSNRTYFHRKECSAFLHPSKYVNQVARCDDCAAENCINCKGSSHGGDCPQDEQLQQVLALSRRLSLWCRILLRLWYNLEEMQMCRMGRTPAAGTGRSNRRQGPPNHPFAANIEARARNGRIDRIV